MSSRATLLFGSSKNLRLCTRLKGTSRAFRAIKNPFGRCVSLIVFKNIAVRNFEWSRSKNQNKDY